MKAFLKSVVAGLLAVLLTVSAAFAEDRPAFTPEALDQMLAPIALYPDPLLSQILMAATYPLEVVQAARWSRANPHLKGQEAARAVEPMDWDPSVKSLVAFPQILHRMDEQLDWTQRLGEAFLAQEPHVMDAIQGLRQRAERAGNLRSNEQMRVTRQDDQILIEPAQPQVVYVPYYDPAVVYGPWWWPAYPPVYWGPPPGYYAWPAYAPGFFWGPTVAISWGFFFGHFDWRHRHVTVVHKHVLVTRHTTFDRHHTNVTSNIKSVVWEHNPHHRRGVPFRNAAARERFEQSRAAADARRDPDRNSAAQTARRADNNLSADVRQRRMEERHESAVNRVTPNNDSNRTTANRIDERIRPAVPGARIAQPETRSARPETLSVQRETRSAQQDRNTRPERTVPQVNDRRGERRDVQRQQARRADPQPTFVAPLVRSEARPVVAAPVVRAEPRPNPRLAAPAPVVRAAPRPNPAAGIARAAPRQQSGPSHRAELPTPARPSGMIPRAAASVSSHPPRMDSSQLRAGARAFGGAQQHVRPASGGNNRRF